MGYGLDDPRLNPGGDEIFSMKRQSMKIEKSTRCNN
jgi:hypothetical protein